VSGSPFVSEATRKKLSSSLKKAIRENPELRPRGESAYNWRGGFTPCAVCGTTKKKRHSYLCKSCAVKTYKGVLSNRYKGGIKDGGGKRYVKKTPCLNCGKDIPQTNKSKMCKSCFWKFARGEKAPRWNGGLSRLNVRIRQTPEYRNWRSEIFRRDFFRCVYCEHHGNDIHAHHVVGLKDIVYEENIDSVPKALQSKVLFNSENGITLCENCHKKEHYNKEIL
jgi:hypothetical protein